MGLLDMLFGGQPAQPPAAPPGGGLLGPDLARVTSAAPLLSYQDYASNHALEQALGGFRKGLLSGIIGMATDDRPEGYQAYLARAQALHGADTKNQLGDIDLNYYKGVNTPQKNPAAGLLGAPPVPAGLLGGGPPPAAPQPIGAPPVPGVQAGAPAVPPPPPGMMPPPPLPSAPMAAAPASAAPGGSGFMLDPATMIARAAATMRVPALKDQATQYLKMAESALTNGLGVQNNGTVAPLPGMEPSKARLAYANSLGETVAGNNKSFDVAPGAMHFQGPTSLSGSPGGFSRPMVNPNPTQQNIINMPGTHTFFDQVGKGLGENATEVLKAGDTATQQLVTTQAMRDLVQAWRDAGGSQSASAPFQAKAAAVLQGLGINPESLGLPKDAGPAQAIDALSKKMALGQIGAGGLPANNFSEADRKFVTEMQGSIADTPSGFEAKILMAERLAQRSQAAQQSLSQVLFNGPPETAPQRYSQWKASFNANSAMRPLFTPEDKARIKALVDQSKAEAKGSGATGAAGPTPPGGNAAPPVQGARQAPDGNWYVPDPQRPGKYLMVQP